jgi:HEAT repeat protein
LYERFAGKKIRCKQCNEPFTVPDKAKPAAPATPALEPAWSGAALPKSRLPLILGVSVGAGLAVIGAIILLVCLLLPSSMDQHLQDLKSSDRKVSADALEWLAEADVQAGQRAKVIGAVEPLLLDGDVHGNLSPDILLRVYLAWADKDEVPAMIRMVENPTLPVWSAEKTGLVMGALARTHDERAIDALAQKLPDPALHDQAVNALKVMGPRAEAAVLDCLFDKDPATRERARQLLDAYGTRPAAIATEALNALNSDNADVRNSAVVWFVDNTPANEQSKAAAGKALVKLLKDPDPKARSQALNALVRWATKDCLPELLEYARGKQMSASSNHLLLDVLGQIPDEVAANAVALELPNSKLRARAVKVLLREGPAADKAVLRYLNYPDTGVQNDVRDLARLLNIPADSLVQQTLTDVAGADIPRSVAALQYLAQLRPDEASRAKVSRALNAPLADANVAIQQAALTAVRLWGTTENTATLLKLLGDLNEVRMERNAGIIEILGLLKDPKAAPILAQGLTDGRERSIVGKALCAMGPGAEDAVIPFLASPDRGARVEACLTLAEIGTAKSMKPLQDALFQSGQGDGFFVKQVETAVQRIMART